MKRIFDLISASIGLILTSPILLPTIFAIWIYDFHNPFYRPLRVGRYGKMFKMVKLRSMIVNADKAGASSTGNQDSRITPVGHFIRRYKLDELIQLWNVFWGDMSLVGPRPTLKWETETYTDQEKLLLTVRPGITNLASIVLSDEGEILKTSRDADQDYLRLIRPWKSRLALVSIEHQSLFLDLKIIFLTVLAIISKPRALVHVNAILNYLGAPQDLAEFSLRKEPLGDALAITKLD